MHRKVPDEEEKKD